MKFFNLLIVFLIFFKVTSPKGLSSSEMSAIRSVFEMQENAWNSGDLEKFMEGYWNSEKLVFVGSRGPKYGWKETLEGYKKGYPDKKTMGKLKFTTLSVSKIDKKTIFLVGKFNLIREEDNVSGYFTLVWKKIKGKWLIISDHSSSAN